MVECPIAAGQDARAEKMALIDYFAGQALAGLMANRAPHPNIGRNRAPGWQSSMAWDAYSIARAMLEERENG